MSRNSMGDQIWETASVFLFLTTAADTIDLTIMGSRVGKLYFMVLTQCYSVHLARPYIES